MTDNIESIFQSKIEDLHNSYASNALINRSTANVARTFDNFYTNQSVKSEYSRSDYDYFRPSEHQSNKIEDNIRTSMKAYDRVGIVKNVIDLMGDFTAKGIRLVHSNPKHQRFFREWFDHIQGPIISERFANYLYRMANVPVMSTKAKVPVKIQNKWQQAYGESVFKVKHEKRVIPVKYTFINPLTIEVIAPELSVYTGKPMYALRIGTMLKNTISRLQRQYNGIDYSSLIDLVPGVLKDAVKNNKKLIPFTDDIAIYYYKKDDWEIWAKPMIYSIIDDIIMLEKMKLADISALDGAISNIRLWTIGVLGDNPQNTILPTKPMIDKLRSILAHNVGGGTMDLVWGPELTFKESNTQVHHFLGMDKYEPVLFNIHQGLGVPTSVTGSTSGFGNNFISMQTLIERLTYGRSVLTSFWDTEIKKVTEAMGFDSPAKVQYDKIILGDETSTMKLLLEIWDRGLITDDIVQESFDYFPELVKNKLIKEFKDRKKGRLPPKGGPYFNPNTEDEMKKIILQRGGVTPSEMGIDLMPRKDGEVSPNEQMAQLKEQYAPPKANGRPKNAKDSEKRKRKTVNTFSKGFVDKFIWANGIQEKLTDIMTDGFVSIKGKKDVRALAEKDKEILETIKFKILCNLKPFEELDDTKLAAAVKQSINPEFLAAAKTLALRFQSLNDRAPTLKERKEIQASAYALVYEEVNEPLSTEEELTWR